MEERERGMTVLEKRMNECNVRKGRREKVRIHVLITGMIK